MIAERIERTIFQELAPKSIHYVPPVKHNQAQGLVARVYEQMIRDFQLVPPLTVHSPVPELLAGVWAATRESVVSGPASRVQREAVIATISRINTCSFCVDVHSIALYGASEHDLADVIARGEDEKIADPQLRALVQWAAATRTPGARILRHPPLSPVDAAQIIGSALMFHYINRPVNVFLDESPLPSMTRGLKGVAKRLAGLLIGRQTLQNTPSPGDSLSLLPEASLPEEFQWARSNPYVAGAWARFAAVVEATGRKALPEEVQALVSAHVNAWNGEEMGISRGWVEGAIAGIREEYKPAARLTLLSALASHQVDEGVINAFRVHQPKDADLVAAVAWASFTATRRISRWLYFPGD